MSFYITGCHDLNTKALFLIEVGVCVYDICKSIVVVNGVDTGKKSVCAKLNPDRWDSR